LNRAFIAVFGVAVFFAILFGSLAFDSVLASPPPKVIICHDDVDGDGVGAETIEVSMRALPAHLAHGDHVDACFCGDNLVGGAEECDDGNTAPGDGCNAVCVAEFCGDNIINNLPDIEQCDGTELDGMTCFGLTGNEGPLDCDSFCDFETSGCIED